MAIGSSTTIPPAINPEDDAPKAKVLHLPINDSTIPDSGEFAIDEIKSEVREVSTMQDYAARKAEEAIANADQFDTEPAAAELDFAVTPEVETELACGGGDLEYGEFADDSGDYPVHDEEVRYLPGIDVHPADKAPEISVIGAGRRSEANMVARAEQLAYAKKRGFLRIMRYVLNFHPDGHIETQESDIDDDERRNQAVKFIFNSIEQFQLNDIDPSDEELFQLVAEALLNYLGSKWKLHLTDGIVDTVSRIVVDKDTDDEDLDTTLKLIGLSNEEWQFEAMQKFAEFADEYGDMERRKGNKSDVSGNKFADMAETFKSRGDELNLSFPIFAYALAQSNTWKEGTYLVAVLRKPSEELKASGAFGSTIEISGYQKRLIATFDALKERSQKAFAATLVKCASEPTLQAAGRRVARRLQKFNQGLTSVQ